MSLSALVQINPRITVGHCRRGNGDTSEGVLRAGISDPNRELRWNAPSRSRHWEQRTGRFGLT